MKQMRNKSNAMTKHMGMLPVLLVAMAILVLGAGCGSGSGSEAQAQAVVELDDAVIRVETNATDEDAGFQIFLDGEGWENVSITDPNGTQIFDSTASGGIFQIGGGTELFLETAEPEFVDFANLQELLDLLPEGEYTFSGTTAEGDDLTGTAELTYVLPCEPEVVSPAEFEILDATAPILVSWDPVDQVIDPVLTVADNVVCVASADLVIDGYQIIVEEESGIEFDIILSGAATEVTVPEEMFEENTLYKFEVLAIEESGNQTITESFFCTGPDVTEDECEELFEAL